jgi:hypothetical protein
MEIEGLPKDVDLRFDKPTRDILKEPMESKETFGGIATRTKKDLAYCLIPPEAEDREAKRFYDGAIKHGDNNWKQGDWTFVVQCVNHLEAHTKSFKRYGNMNDDNIAAIKWNASAIIWFEHNKVQEYNKAIDYLQGKVLNGVFKK